MTVNQVISAIEAAIGNVGQPVLTLEVTQDAYDLLSESPQGKYPPFQLYIRPDGSAIDLAVLPEGTATLRLTTVAGDVSTHAI